MKTELLLSEKFMEFSQKINAIHEKKKQLLVEFKKQYEAHKAEIKLLEEEAASLATEFEAQETKS
jgi:hypothetical protein